MPRSFQIMQANRGPRSGMHGRARIALEDNGDAPLKNLLLHHQVIVPVTAGKADLGPWQQIYYAEFDGRRRKRVVIKGNGRIKSSTAKT